MEFDTYQEEDDVLRRRARLSLCKTYSLSEAIKLSNRINLFDTVDGYRVIIIKERDPAVFGFDHPVAHVSMQAQRGSEVLIPKTQQGWVSLAARMMVRLGLGEYVGQPVQSQARGTTIHVWFMVEQWADQPTQPQLVKSS